MICLLNCIDCFVNLVLYKHDIFLKKFKKKIIDQPFTRFIVNVLKNSKKNASKHTSVIRFRSVVR